tara:strand:+ start:374 stop:580 length:207 start_codon:yes stop_codon:yes gene_type:complete
MNLIVSAGAITGINMVPTNKSAFCVFPSEEDLTIALVDTMNRIAAPISANAVRSVQISSLVPVLIISI